MFPLVPGHALCLPQRRNGVDDPPLYTGPSACLRNESSEKMRAFQAAIPLISFLPCLPSSAPSSSSVRASMSQSGCTREALPGG
ncbi:hypothetical protein CCUS01_04374 [Colletotrichum cuscutae]|uniref:Uncharacterized protein n=1 Tax=Colletotrichum cuscutae TaxID=1209917 RepID=A0AAI9VBF5_9PEZI|nr:hypothetical protein CCUS01_04374 [Colletotrichum cuscutae]